MTCEIHLVGLTPVLAHGFSSLPLSGPSPTMSRRRAGTAFAGSSRELRQHPQSTFFSTDRRPTYSQQDTVLRENRNPPCGACAHWDFECALQIDAVFNHFNPLADAKIAKRLPHAWRRRNDDVTSIRHCRPQASHNCIGRRLGEWVHRRWHTDRTGCGW